MRADRFRGSNRSARVRETTSSGHRVPRAVPLRDDRHACLGMLSRWGYPCIHDSIIQKHHRTLTWWKYMPISPLRLPRQFRAKNGEERPRQARGAHVNLFLHQKNFPPEAIFHAICCTTNTTTNRPVRPGCHCLPRRSPTRAGSFKITRSRSSAAAWLLQPGRRLATNMRT